MGSLILGWGMLGKGGGGGKQTESRSCTIGLLQKPESILDILTVFLFRIQKDISRPQTVQATLEPI